MWAGLFNYLEIQVHGTVNENCTLSWQKDVSEIVIHPSDYKVWREFNWILNSFLAFSFWCETCKQLGPSVVLEEQHCRVIKTNGRLFRWCKSNKITVDSALLQHLYNESEILNPKYNCVSHVVTSWSLLNMDSLPRKHRVVSWNYTSTTEQGITFTPQAWGVTVF